MAFFKMLQGDDADISLDITPFHEGWAYITSNGYYYIDLNIGTVESPNNQRIKLNAQNAETLCGLSLEEIRTAIKPKKTTITCLADNWTGDANLFAQTVTVNGATANSKVDIYPTPDQLVELQTAGISLVAVNDDGVVTVYAINNKPTSDYNMQVTLTEINQGGVTNG